MKGYCFYASGKDQPREKGKALLRIGKKRGVVQLRRATPFPVLPPPMGEGPQYEEKEGTPSSWRRRKSIQFSLRH